jgi:hypothetical protein
MNKVLNFSDKSNLFFKIFARAIFSNMVIWAIIFTTLQPFFDWITGDKILAFYEYLMNSVFSGFIFGLLEATIAYYLVSNVLNKYGLSIEQFQYGKPYQKTQNLYLDIPTVLNKIEKWNRNVHFKFIVQKIDNQTIELIKATSLITLHLEYGKITISSKHRHWWFFIEQGQNIENVELLFLILKN